MPTPGEKKWNEEQEPQATEGPVWQGTGSPISLIRFSPAGDIALVALVNGSCHILNTSTGTSVVNWEIAEPANPVAAEIAIDGKTAILQLENSPHLYVRNLADGTLQRTIENTGRKITTWAVAADPRLVAAGDDEGSIRIWNVVTGELLEQGFGRIPEAKATALAFSNDCRELYVAHSGGTAIDVYTLPQLSYSTSMEPADGISTRFAVSFTNALLTTSQEGVAEVYGLTPPTSPKQQPYPRLGGVALRHGGPRNCFFLSDTNQICNYLGGKSFEYYALPSGGLAGSQIGADDGAAPLAVARDGAQAATALADGSVHFYKLPGASKSLAVQQRELGQRLKSLFTSKSYDEFDELADRSLKQTAPAANRWSPSMIAILWMCRPDPRSGETWESHLAELQKWLDAKPESGAAQLILANTFANYAWSLRGSDIAARTSKEAFKGFHEQLEKADEILERADQAGPSAPLGAICIKVSMGLGKPKADLIRIWQRGVDDTPEFAPLHLAIVKALLPQWGGSKGSVAELSERARTTIGGQQGLVAYAVMAEAYFCDAIPSDIVQDGFDLDRLDEAAEAMVQLYPENVDSRGVAAIVACLRHDQPKAADHFRALAGTCDLAMWKKKPVFDQFREWSRTVPPRGVEPRFSD